MLERLARLSERMGTSFAESRRGFLQRAGLGVLTLTGTVAAALLGPGTKAKADAEGGLGACYYTLGGAEYCRQLTADQCETYNGSTWLRGQQCALLPRRE